MGTEAPFVSVLVPVLDEEDYIIDCLESVAEGHYPLSRLEVLVIDGGSSDGTTNLVQTYIFRHPWVRLLYNPGRTVPAAMNLGIAEARHDILVWLGAHAVYAPEYLIRSVSILQSENCAAVGGIIQPEGKTLLGSAIANATSSWFGTGRAPYRHATERMTVDTVFAGCWHKKDLLAIGGFDEAWVHNQDYELNHRLRSQVGPIILDPEIRCRYYCRETLGALAKQYFQYGYWRFRTLIRHPGSFRARQGAPVLLLLGLCISGVLSIYGSWLAVLVPVSYLLLTAIVSLFNAIAEKRFVYAFLLPLVFPVIHLSWALGFVRSSANSFLKLGKTGS